MMTGSAELILYVDGVQKDIDDEGKQFPDPV